MDGIINIFVGIFKGLGDIAFLAGLGIPIICIVLMLVMSFMSNYGKNYRAAVKKVMDYLEKNPDNKDITECLKHLPEEPRNCLKNFMRLRKGRPSEHFSVEACVDSPLKRGWAGVLSKISASGAAFFSIVFLCSKGLSDSNLIGEGVYAGYLPTGIELAAVGAILLTTWLSVIVLLLIEKLGYTATLRAHKSLTEMLDNSFSNFAPVAPQGKAPQQAQGAKAPAQGGQPQAQQRPQAPQAQQQAPQAQQQAPQAQQQAPQAQQQAPQAQQQAPQAQQQAPQMQQQAPQAQQQAPQAPQAPRPSSEIDVLLQRVNGFASGEASPAEMKEVAVKLQGEKAKPENKTPEIQKRINDGLAMLLRAMQAKPK